MDYKEAIKLAFKAEPKCDCADWGMMGCHSGCSLEQWKRARELVEKLPNQLAAAVERAEKLQAFKDWVHKYLDDKSIPHHPPGTHGAEGCRIGDRMDYVFAAKEQVERERAQAIADKNEMVARNALLRRRPDLPMERIRDYDNLVAKVTADRDRLAAENAKLREALVKADILLYELNLLETKKKTLPDHLASRVADIFGETRAALAQVPDVTTQKGGEG